MGDNFPPEFPDTQATVVSNMVFVVLPVMTLDNVTTNRDTATIREQPQ